MFCQDSRDYGEYGLPDIMLRVIVATVFSLNDDCTTDVQFAALRKALGAGKRLSIPTSTGKRNSGNGKCQKHREQMHTVYLVTHQLSRQKFETQATALP